MPHFLTAAAVKPDIRPFNSEFDGFFIHITEHQNFAGIGILNNSRNQTLFIEFYIFHFVFHFIYSISRCNYFITLRCLH